jgi:hypothetical protein
MKNADVPGEIETEDDNANDEEIENNANDEGLPKVGHELTRRWL